jgi:hypothetical protein
MKHPIIYGRDVDDTPNYKTISEGKIIDDNQYPTIIDHTPGYALNGRVYWQGRGKGTAPDSCCALSRPVLSWQSFVAP